MWQEVTGATRPMWKYPLRVVITSTRPQKRISYGLDHLILAVYLIDECKVGTRCSLGINQVVSNHVMRSTPNRSDTCQPLASNYVSTSIETRLAPRCVSTLRSVIHVDRPLSFAQTAAPCSSRRCTAPRRSGLSSGTYRRLGRVSLCVELLRTLPYAFYLLVP